MRVLGFDGVAPRPHNREFPLINERAILGLKTDTRHDQGSDASDFVLPGHNFGGVEATPGLHVSQILLNEGSGGAVRSFFEAMGFCGPIMRSRDPMGQHFDFVFDLLIRSGCSASASEVATWRSPIGGWEPTPSIWAVRGVYINPSRLP